MKNNVVAFPLSLWAKHRLSVRNPAPRIPDERLAEALAEIDKLIENEKPGAETGPGGGRKPRR